MTLYVKSINDVFMGNKPTKFRFHSSIDSGGMFFLEDVLNTYQFLYSKFFTNNYNPILDRDVILSVLEKNKFKFLPATYLSIIQKVKKYKQKNAFTEYIFDIIIPSISSNHNKLSIPKIKNDAIVKTLLLDIEFYTRKNPNDKDKEESIIQQRKIYKTTIKPHHYRNMKKNIKGVLIDIKVPYFDVRIYQIDVTLIDKHDIYSYINKMIYEYDYDENNKHTPNPFFTYVINEVFSTYSSFQDPDRSVSPDDEVMQRVAVNDKKEDGSYGRTDDPLLLYRAYVEAFKILKIHNFSNARKKNPLYSNLMRNNCISKCSEYIITKVDFNQATFQEAIHNNEHIQGECVINAFYDHYKTTLMSDSKRKPLTREKIIELMGISESQFVKNGSNILSLEPVFIEYKIRVRIYDALVQTIIYQYDPLNFNRHVQPFCCMIKNGHIYVLNHNLPSLVKMREKEVDIVKASSNYYIPLKQEIPHHEMISHVDDLIVILKRHFDYDLDIKIYTLILKDISMPNILFDIYEAGYECDIIYKNGGISSIKLILENVSFIIIMQKMVQYSIKDNVYMDNIEDYDKCSLLLDTMKESVFTKENLSYYSKIDIMILDEYRTTAPLGKINEILDLDYVEIDLNKAYTYQFSLIDTIPVFSVFDEFEIYKDELIEDYNMYIIETHESNILFFKKNMLLYGSIIKKISNLSFKILHVKKPSTLRKVNFGKLVTNLWESELTNNDKLNKSLKKLICNVVIGSMSKSISKISKSYLFNNIDEALHYKNTLDDGSINCITKYIKEKQEEDFDENVYVNEKVNEINKIIYSLSFTDSCKLENGYRFISELIIQNHNYHMYDSYIKLQNKNISVTSVKIDAMTILKSDLKKAMTILSFSNKFGDFDYKDDFTYPTLDYKQINNRNIEIISNINNIIDVVDEFDTDSICNELQIKKNCLIIGLTPGSGKSYLCSCINKKKLFVVPTNRLVMKYKNEKHDSVTINKFFSIAMGGEKYVPFDYSCYECIIFDEIYFCNLYVLSRIKNFIKNHSNLIIVATGDVLQLKSVERMSNNIIDEKEYLNKCVYSLFDNVIELKINKRFENKEDHIKLLSIKNYIYSDSFNMKSLIDTYFKYTNDINLCINNVAYTNKTCMNVSKIIRKKLNLLDDYVIGERLINRKYIKGLSVNYVYIIHEITKFKFVLKDIDTDTYHNVNIKYIQECFIYDYCYTGHSLQGSSLSGSICVYDYDNFYVSKDWIYVVITRAKNLNDVYFYKK